jgi:hypothetical protein
MRQRVTSEGAARKRIWVGVGIVFMVLLVLLLLTTYRTVETDSRSPYVRADPVFDETNVVLVLWPDHIELRRASQLSGLLPRPKDAAYTFLVPHERRKWVEEQVQKYPFEHSEDSGWYIDIKQVAPDKQTIEVDRVGHHRMGLIYEVTPNAVIPLQTRRYDPIFALGLLFIPLTIAGVVLCGALCAFGLFLWKIRMWLKAFYAARLNRIQS